MTGPTVQGWTVDTLNQHLTRQLVDLRTLLDERYATQTKALDAAFMAQQQAMRTALDAAKEAVNKSEVAAEDRFRSVNEFRGQLADQAATFVPRLEADARISESNARLSALIDRLDSETGAMAERIREVETRLTSRLDLFQGAQIGETALALQRRQQTGMVVGIIGAVIAAVSIAVALILGLNN